MTENTPKLSALRRPRILVRAARFGLNDYNRDRDLKRLMDLPVTPCPQIAVDDLLAREATMEQTRNAGDASYSIARHVEILIALMSEARLLPRKNQVG